MRARLPVVLALSFLAVGIANAVPKKSIKRTGASKASANPIGSFQPINPASTWIQPAFISDFGALYRAKSKSVASKGEFETTAQFEARSAISTDFYAVPANLWSKYDADKGRFDVLLEANDLQAETSLELRSFGRKPAVVLSQARSEEGHYLGSNAFGVKKNITRVRMREDAIAMARPLGEGLGADSFYVPISLERAPTTKLGFLIVFQVEATSLGLTAADSGFDGPTVDAPFDMRTDTRYIFVGETFLWAYDKVSGEVYQKFKIGDPKQ